MNLIIFRLDNYLIANKMNATEVENCIAELNAGNESVLDNLFPVVYEELRRNAHYLRSNFRGIDTLNTTALVHEAYMKLAKADLSKLENKSHFYHLASKALRQIIINACEQKKTQKRGDGAVHLHIDDLEESLSFDDSTQKIILKIEEVLTELEEKEPAYGKLVEYRFFAGLSIEETAHTMGLSASSVKRKWSMIRTLLHSELNLVSI